MELLKEFVSYLTDNINNSDFATICFEVFIAFFFEWLFRKIKRLLKKVLKKKFKRLHKFFKRTLKEMNSKR